MTKVPWRRHARARDGSALPPPRPLHARSREQLRVDGALCRLHRRRKRALQQKTWTSRTVVLSDPTSAPCIIVVPSCVLQQREDLCEYSCKWGQGGMSENRRQCKR